MKKLFVNFFCVALMATTASAQFSTPAPSPSGSFTQTVGLTTISVEYSRPSMKGRTVFADKGAMLPYGEVWRTGANSATKITFSEDVKVGDSDLKKGSYALLTKPGKSSWEVMFFTYDVTNFNSYLEKKPAATILITPGKTGMAVETFTMQVGSISTDGANLDLMWENTLVSIPVKVHTSKQVEAAFKKLMEGPSNNEYYNMGLFMADNGGDMNKALEYVQKATKTGEPRFWMLRQESLILAKMGKKKEAIEVAKKSLELSKEAKNNDYIRMNEQSLKEWGGM